jgi:hypothetical protein
MIGDNLYVYFDNDAPNSKINYSYSTFHGSTFINSWRKNRMAVELSRVNEFKIKFFSNTETGKTFERWIQEGFHNFPDESSDLLLLLKRFEVTKKIYDSYDSEFRPDSKSKYDNLSLYAMFGYVLVRAYKETQFLPLLNTLLKINDILISQKTMLDQRTNELAAFTINEEHRFINELIQRLNE